jgi:hypothetical protein
MRKIFAALLLLCLCAVGTWYFLRHRHRASQALPELRAMMRDEDAPRVIEPSIALDVNETADTKVWSGAAVWFSVGANNAAAANEIASAQALQSKLERLPANAPGKERLRAVWQQRANPAKITLGSAAHPWTEAIQLLVRDASGGERPLGIPLQLLGSPVAVVELDAYTAVRANFGATSLPLPAGTYAIVACLGATGSWQGKICSEPASLTVADPPQRLTKEQEVAADEQSARLALLAGNPQALDEYGHKLVAADPDSVSGHMYLGEASFQRGKWDDALREFTTARGQFGERHPKALEPPQFLNLRINQSMEKSSPE